MVHTFLDFELDEDLYELRSRGEVIATQARVFALIVYLLHARDRVVGKGELMKALWKGNVVSETAISQVVMLARKALGDEGETQRVIKTVRGRGFRFVAPVGSVAARAATREAATDARESEPDARPPAAAKPNSPAAVRGAALLGRERELRELGERLSELELGVGGVVLVTGEPGIGKTSLTEALASQASERGIEVIWGRAWEEGGAPPFWPWVQVLRAMLEREDADQLRSYLHASAAGLLPLLPEHARPPEGQRALPALLPYGEDTDASRARFRQFDAMARWLRFACGRAPGVEALPGLHRPRLIILDDLHAADVASIELTRFLMPELREMGLLLVGTYRDLERAGIPALTALAESCAAQTLRLRGLSAAEAAELVARRLGTSSPARWARALHRISLGNPLLLAELCSHFDADGPGPLVEFSELSDFAIPERVAGAVRRHLAQLPGATRDALSTAAVLGREFSLPLLAALALRSEAELLETLSPALRQGVLRPAASSAARLMFSHGLVRNAVYAELLPGARIELHRRIGEALEQGAAGSPSPSLYELAHHFYMAAPDGGRLKAFDYAHQAANQAYEMMAFETAAGLYDRALQLAEHEAIDGALLHELLCSAGNAWSRSGEIERACARFERAAGLARGTDPERFAWAVVRAASARRGTLLHEPVYQQQLREALAQLPPGDSEIKALVLSGSTLGLRSVGSVAERERTTRAAVEMARRLGNDPVLQWTLNARHLLLWGAASPLELVAIADEMVEIGKRTQDHELLLDGLLWRALDFSELGDMAASLRAQHEYRAEAEHFGSPWHRYNATGCQIFEAGAQCDFARAAQLSERARALGLRLQDSLAEPFYALRSLFADLFHGAAAAERGSCGARREPPSCVPADYRPFWALSWAEHGHFDAARAVLEQVLAQEREQLLLDHMRRPTLAAMAQVSARLGERAAAEELYALLSPDAGRQLLLQAYVAMGPVHYYLGMLAATLGRRELARQHFEGALVQCEYARPLLLHVRYEYARLLAGEEPARARRLLTEVELAAGPVGMERLQARARAALMEAG
jgi:DNA-binding winged helix-turn-helix (wHTH) protein/tetratricopeptide (TPR) repeat protein